MDVERVKPLLCIGELKFAMILLIKLIEWVKVWFCIFT